MTDIKPIETRYAGCRFRSRLEARWSIFFDALEIEWSYEIQGFNLPSGRYLPDFWLPGVRGGIWFEVKGQSPTEIEEKLASELAVQTGSEVVVAFGEIPWPKGKYGDLSGERWFFFSDGGMDLPFEWCIGPSTGAIGIEFSGYGDRVDDSREEVITSDHPRLIAAYRTARSARFEHGESPTGGAS